MNISSVADKSRWMQLQLALFGWGSSQTGGGEMYLQLQFILPHLPSSTSTSPHSTQNEVPPHPSLADTLKMPWQTVPSLLIIAGAFNVAAGLMCACDYLAYGKVRRVGFVSRDVSCPPLFVG